MKINYKLADGTIIEWEVSDTDGNVYLELVKAEQSCNRRNTRRHTSLSTFTYEDARFFSNGTDLLADLISNEVVRDAMSQLNERQQYLIRKCFLEGWSYTDLAAHEGKDESAIRHAVNRAIARLRKSLL